MPVSRASTYVFQGKEPAVLREYKPKELKPAFPCSCDLSTSSQVRGEVRLSH